MSGERGGGAFRVLKSRTVMYCAVVQRFAVYVAVDTNENWSRGCVARMLASEFLCVNREAIKYRFDGVPMDSPRGAQRQAVQAAQHEPTGCALAQQSGDFCDARLTRAPQETGESLGSPSFGYFSWRRKKSDWPRAGTKRAGARHRSGWEGKHHPLPQHLSPRWRGE